MASIGHRHTGGILTGVESRLYLKPGLGACVATGRAPETTVWTRHEEVPDLVLLAVEP